MRQASLLALILATGCAVPHASAQNGLQFPPGASSGTGFQLRSTAPLAERYPPERSQPALAVTRTSPQGFNFARAPGFDMGGQPPVGFGAIEAMPPPTFGLGLPTGTGLDYRINRWTLSSSVRQGLASMRPGSTRLDVGASYGFNIAPRHQIMLFGGVGFAASGTLQPDSNSELAVRSALRPYGAGTGTGLRDMGLRLSWRYTLDRRLFVDTSIGYERHLTEGMDAAGGLDRNVGSFGAMFGYRFY